MDKKPKIAVIVRLKWNETTRLLPAMGRTQENALLVQDIESPETLCQGLRDAVVEMVTKEGAQEIIVIGSSVSNSKQDVIARVNTLRTDAAIPKDIYIHGLLYDPATYKLDLVLSGYEQGELNETVQ